MPKKIVLSDAQLSKLRRLYAQGKSHRDVAKLVGLSSKVVRTRLTKLGEMRAHDIAARRFVLNDGVFGLGTEETMYWIGFLMADGNVHHTYGRQARISLALMRSDRGHIEKFAKFVGAPSSNIYDYSTRAISKLTLASDRMAEDLALCGVIPCKSMVAKIPTGRTDLLYSRHYWRGVLDGDGCIYLNKRNYCSVSLTSGSPEFLAQFERFLKKENLKTGTVYKITYALHGEKAVAVVRALYNGASVYLARKYDKAMLAITNSPVTT